MRRFRTLLLALVPPVVFQAAKTDPKPVPMRDVVIRGSATGEPKEVRAVLEAGIRTPFGRIPIRGNLLLTYDCGSAFTSRLSYSAWVRLFAKLKGVDLITEMDGVVKVQDPPECPAMAVQVIQGRATVDALQLSGWLKLDGDSLNFQGPAYVVGDSSYHSTLTSAIRGRALELKVNMYER